MSTPAITTLPAQDIFGTHFMACADITDFGGLPVLWWGFCFLVGATGVPNCVDNFVVREEGPHPASYVSLMIAGLTGGADYRVRSFVQNADGLAYGDTISVKTFVDLRILCTERMIGAEHPTLMDTLNRLILAQHHIDGTHSVGISAVVDTFDDLPAGAPSDLALVKLDSVVAKTLPNIVIGTEYPIIYGNPNISIPNMELAGDVSAGITIDGVDCPLGIYPAGDELIPVPYLNFYKFVILETTEETMTGVQTQWLYMSAISGFWIGTTYIVLKQGWVELSVKLIFDLLYPSEGHMVEILAFYDFIYNYNRPPILANITIINPYSQLAGMQNYIFDVTPFVVNPSGIYQKGADTWCLVLQNPNYTPVSLEV